MTYIRFRTLKRCPMALLLTTGLLACALSLSADPHHPEATPPADLTGGVEKLLGLAESALEEHEFQVAESHYRSALFDSWLLLGTLEVASDHLEAAQSALEQATQTAAVGQRIARISLALVQAWTGEIDEAVHALRTLLDEKPRDARTRLHLAHALVLAGEMEDARRELESLRAKLPEPVARLEQALEDTEDDAEARRQAFMPRLNVGRLAGLSAADRDTLRTLIQATQAQIFHNLAVLHTWADRPDRAAAHVARAKELTPPAGVDGNEVAPLGIDLRNSPPFPAEKPLRLDEETIWSTASTDDLPIIKLMRAEKLDEAAAELHKRLEGSDDAVARDLLALLLTDKGRLEEAETQLVAALNAQPEAETEAAMRQHLARLYLMRGNEDAALTELRAVPEGTDLPLDLGLKLAAADAVVGKKANAKALLEALNQQHRSVRAILALVDLLIATEGPEAASNLLMRARALAPSSEMVLALCARTWITADNVEGAVEALGDLRRMHPEVAEYPYLLGIARMKQERFVEAREALQSAVTMDPSMVKAQEQLAMVCEKLGDQPCVDTFRSSREPS